MEEQEPVTMEAPRARKADAIPRRRVFVMGNGRTVQPSVAKSFCDVVVEDCLDSRAGADPEFALGFAACLDAVSRGTIGLAAYPSDVVAQAHSDVHDVTARPNRVTDIMRGLGE